MIIDQLPALATAGDNDEIAIEVGTTTYKIKKSDFLKEFMPKSGGEFTGDVAVGGVLDVTKRRCYGTLSSPGWYRVFNVTAGLGRAGSSFTITLHIGRAYVNTNNELHTVTLLANLNNQEFSSEVSKSNSLGITKVRYTADGSNNGHIDIYYDLTAENFVYVDFDVHCRPENAYLIRYNSVTPTAVAASPSGETVLTEYTFAANTINPFIRQIQYSGTTDANGNLEIPLTVANYASKHYVLQYASTYATALSIAGNLLYVKCFKYNGTAQANANVTVYLLEN